MVATNVQRIVTYDFDTTKILGGAIFHGTGAPTFTAPKGSLYIRADGTTTNNRVYINTDGAGTWTYLTTGA